MKLIDNLILIDLKNTNYEYLLVNSINGLIDVINQSEYDIMNRWISVDNIVVENDHEIELYKQLLDREYIMTLEKESEVKAKLIEKLSQDRKEVLNKCKNASFIFSYKCNFSCPYCFEKNIEDDNSPFTTDMADAVIKLYPNGIDNIGFYGGEPLLLSNRKIIEYIMKSVPNANYSAITNGYNLKEYFYLFKSVKTIQIQVTLDGTREQHNKTRTLKGGQGSYDIIIEGIRLYINNKIPIKVRMNISSSNFEDCIRQKESLISEFKNSEYLTFEIQGLFQHNSSEKAAIEKKLIDDDINNNKQQNVILNTLPSLSRFFYKGSRIKPIIHSCLSEEQTRIYDNKGNIYSCMLSVGSVNKSIGNYYPEYNLKKNSMNKRSTLKIDKCMNCRLIFLCGGGCPNPVVEENGNAFKPNCINIRHQIDYTIPYLYNKKYNKDERKI